MTFGVNSLDPDKVPPRVITTDIRIRGTFRLPNNTGINERIAKAFVGYEISGYERGYEQNSAPFDERRFITPRIGAAIRYGITIRIIATLATFGFNGHCCSQHR